MPKSLVAPTLAYGRHRGPSRDQSRVAAVVIAMYQQEGQWMIPLTLRPATLQHHADQICLPGGRLERGETPTEAALREYQEELGVNPLIQIHCGELSTQYVFGSDNQVHP
ncbi:MAG: NUDIX domain-containing protein, partial [Pirellulaceae bacterium]|nr:NUDIX domain-containing protein [Pirellulaceae bacterium]